MTRTVAREIVMRLGFELSVLGCTADELLDMVFDSEYYETLASEDEELFGETPDDKQRAYIETLIRGLYEHNAELDAYIEKYSVGWKFSRISRTAVAIMKTAMYEVLYMPEIPRKAAINEAVELAKKYEEPETVPFINGVLGAFVKGETEGL